MDKKNLSFEKAMDELEEIIEKMESKKPCLDESMELFKKGIDLAAFLDKKIDEAEQKITMLLKDKNGRIKEEIFNDTEK